MKVISVASVKGGVGKTTTIAMLGHYAAEHGLRTLLIDADVQASLTVSFFDDIDEIENHDTTYQLMVEDGPITPIPIRDNLSILPADAYLSRLSESKDLKVMMCLKERIGEQFPDRYDLVLIDTPGSTSTVLASALGASNHVYSPIELQKYSVRAFKEVMDLIKSVRGSINAGLKFEGFLPNRIRGIRTNAAGQPEPNSTKQRAVFEELQSIGPGMILGMFGLRDAIGAAEDGQSVQDARGRGSQVARNEIEAFANELLGRAGFKFEDVAEAHA
ncbi:MAG: ParA family protein [Pseudomonadota bacterium]